MEIKILKDEKNELEILIDSLTLVEVLRSYLNQDENVSFAAWKQEHPNKPILLKIETKGKTAKKALQDAIEQIEKETEKLVDEIKKN
ncbi:MAG TPA: RpoL/Rpb11 RNA polymerase subunit family protein [Candidatus Paceibacterota bacterium]|nr:RpoL/Rpb11 RNA polymerase subunit family protein [Candidatus Paceibacterota bacterium]